MRIQNTHPITKIFYAVAFAALIGSSASAAIVWELNPEPRQHGPAGSSSVTFTSSGFSLTAYGFDNNGGIGTPRELFFKDRPPVDGAVEFGLGLNDVPHNEINAGLHFIQFDFTALLAAGMMNGEITVGSIQAPEAFAIYGSNTLGTLGTQVGGPFQGLAFDNQSVAIPNFGQFNFYSIVATEGSVLVIAVQGDVPPIPEMNALVPIGALVLLVFATNAWRKRTPRAA